MEDVRGRFALHRAGGCKPQCRQRRVRGDNGPFGQRKSTLLNVVSTVDQPSRGTVRVDGVDPHGLGDEKLAEFRRRKMGFVFQDFNLVHTLTVEENIILPLALDGWPAEKSRARAQELARDLGIASILGKRPTRYRVARRSASRSPARWRQTRRFCLPTSQREVSTPRRRGRSCTFCRT